MKDFETWLAIILSAMAIFLAPKAEAVERDKQQYVAVSIALGAASAAALRETQHPALYGAALALAPGVAKEVYDAGHPQKHTAEWGDLLADIVGVTAGVWLGHDLRIKANRERFEIMLRRAF